MGIIKFVNQLFFDYTFRTVLLGALTLGIVSGGLGAFAVLRRQSLLGDAISHAALPGIAIAFLLTGSKSPVVLVLGAAIAGWLGTLVIMSITHHSRIKTDSALGLVLSVFFGLGLVVLTYIQKMPNANQAGLETYLFGQAATLLAKDVLTMGILGVLSLALMLLFWKELKLLTFDAEFGRSLGFPVRMLDLLLITLLVVAIVIGLQTVGVVLMSAMIVAPAAAARQWTDRFGLMVGLAGILGALAGVSGAILSSTIEHLPTGPTIVLMLSGVVFLSLILAPNRGILWRWLREQHQRHQLQMNAILSDLFILAQHHQDASHGHSIKVLRTMSQGHGGVDRSLKALKAKGLVIEQAKDEWILSAKGMEAAQKLAQSNEVDE